MQVQVRAFAILKDYLPKETPSGQSAAIDVPESATVRQLLRTLGVPENFTPVCTVGGKAVAIDTPLQPGDEVALYPAMAGGSTPTSEPMSEPADAGSFRNPPDAVLRELLTSAHNVAVVGLSPKSDRDSHVVAKYLQEQGYRIIPVNPGSDEILGERAYPELSQIPGEVRIDIVDVFRRPEAVPAVVEQALARSDVRAVWMQLGVIAAESARRAAAAGKTVVMDRCIKVEHQRLFG